MFLFISFWKCDNIIDDLSDRFCLQNKTEKVKTKVFDITIKINES